MSPHLNFLHHPNYSNPSMLSRSSMAAAGYLAIVVAAMLFSESYKNGAAAAAEEEAVDHVVGDDRGWDISSNVAAWSSDRIFRVGDSIWFAYSTAEGGIIELQSKEELESCNMSNPIKMYTNGLDKVSLHGEGTRYFASSKVDKCRKGLKLRVEVVPRAAQVSVWKKSALNAAALAPQSSDSNHLKAANYLLGAIFISLCMWF